MILGEAYLVCDCVLILNTKSGDVKMNRCHITMTTQEEKPVVLMLCLQGCSYIYQRSSADVIKSVWNLRADTKSFTAESSNRWSGSSPRTRCSCCFNKRFRTQARSPVLLSSTFESNVIFWKWMNLLSAYQQLTVSDPCFKLFALLVASGLKCWNDLRHCSDASHFLFYVNGAGKRGNLLCGAIWHSFVPC